MLWSAETPASATLAPVRAGPAINLPRKEAAIAEDLRPAADERGNGGNGEAAGFDARAATQEATPALAGLKSGMKHAACGGRKQRPQGAWQASLPGQCRQRRRNQKPDTGNVARISISRF